MSHASRATIRLGGGGGGGGTAVASPAQYQPLVSSGGQYYAPAPSRAAGKPQKIGSSRAHVNQAPAQPAYQQQQPQQQWQPPPQQPQQQQQQQQQPTTPTTPSGESQYPWRQEGRRERRRRETVPEHHRAVANGSPMGTAYTPSTPAQAPMGVVYTPSSPIQSPGGVAYAPNTPTHTPMGVTYASKAPTNVQPQGPVDLGYKPREPSQDPMGVTYAAKPDTAQTPSYKRDEVMQQEQFHVRPVPGFGEQGDVRYDYAGQSVPDGSGHTDPAPHLYDQMRAQEARDKIATLNLSPQAMAIYRRKFNILDLNKDGVVNIREFAAISRVLGYKFSRDEIMEIFGKRDIDDSGGISFDEFVLAMYERATKAQELAPYRAKFREYDWKDSGYITSDEAYPVLHRELGFDENKTEALIDMYDRNKDYRLSLLEFIDFYKKVEDLKVQVRNAFLNFDRNGDGFIDMEEFKAALKPKKFSAEQAQGLMYKYDRDADGKLNFSEFADFWDIPIA